MARRCAGYLQDERLARQEPAIRFRYLVDNDVISAYVRPETHLKYGRVFDEPVDKDSRLALVLLLGDFLFAADQPLLTGTEAPWPRFVIGYPHAAEYARHVWAVFGQFTSLSQAASDLEQANFDGLKAAIDAYQRKAQRDRVQALIALSTDLAALVPDLVAFFNPYVGAAAEIRRLQKLRMGTFQVLGNYRLPEPLPGVATIDDEIAQLVVPSARQAELFIKWKEHLSHYFSARRPHQQIDSDALVLAMMEGANEELIAQRSQTRLALITGSDYVLEAVERREPAFAESYVRDLRAFVANESFFQGQPFSVQTGDSVASLRVTDWLKVFFAPEGNGLGDVGSKGAVDIHADTSQLSLTPERARALVSEWGSHVFALAEHRYHESLATPATAAARRVSEEITSLRDSGTLDLDGLRDLIWRRTIQAASDLYNTTTFVSLWSSAPALDNAPVPVIRCERVPTFVAYCEAAVTYQMASRNPPVEDGVTRRLLMAIDDLSHHDPYGYYAHVGHALAFMAKGHWAAAISLARFALDIADHIPREDQHEQLGREAAYLAAIAQRHAVRRRGDLDTALGYLEQAQRRNDHPNVGDIRFPLERLALEIRSYSFDMFIDRIAIDLSRAAITALALHEIVDQAERISTEDGQDAKLRNWVLREAIANLLALVLMCREQDPEHAVLADSECVRLNERLGDELALGRERYELKVEIDRYSHLVHYAARVVYSPDHAERTDAKERVKDLIEHWGERKRIHDEGRLNLFLRIVSSDAAG
jgi:tetratricopeptide (TPR) repeat protein